jgi:hypothetical protein
MEDFDRIEIKIGDRVAFADSGGADLVKGIVKSFGDKMITIDREGSGWPKQVRRYPSQVMVMLKID